MDPLTIVAILEAVVKLAEDAPEIVAAVQTVIDCLNSGAAPTTIQQASIDALLEKAHAQLQGS